MGLAHQTWIESNKKRQQSRAGQVRIVGCGRWHQSDDQFGLFVARNLATLGIDAEITTTERPGFDLVLDMDRIDLLVVVDAALASDDFPAGTTRKIKLNVLAADHRECAILRSSQPDSVHTLSVSETLRMAGVLGCVPHHVWIYTVAARRFEPGREITPAVAARIEEVAWQIAADVESHLCGVGPRTDQAMTSACGAA